MGRRAGGPEDSWGGSDTRGSPSRGAGVLGAEGNQLLGSDVKSGWTPHLYLSTQACSEPPPHRPSLWPCSLSAALSLVSTKEKHPTCHPGRQGMREHWRPVLGARTGWSPRQAVPAQPVPVQEHTV